MRRIQLVIILSVMVIGLFSCGKDDYMTFVGTWGVKQIDYYNIDYYGQPIEASRTTFYFTPGDMESGIDLVYRSDRTGEMRDRSRDTLYYNDSTYIVRPDTVLVTPFTFSYHKDDQILYMNVKGDRPYTGLMNILQLENNLFRYTYEYLPNTVEEAVLVRLSNDTRERKSNDKAVKPQYRPRRKNSLLSNY